MVSTKPCTIRIHQLLLTIVVSFLWTDMTLQPIFTVPQLIQLFWDFWNWLQFPQASPWLLLRRHRRVFAFLYWSSLLKMRAEIWRCVLTVLTKFVCRFFLLWLLSSIRLDRNHSYPTQKIWRHLISFFLPFAWCFQTYPPFLSLLLRSSDVTSCTLTASRRRWKVRSHLWRSVVWCCLRWYWSTDAACSLLSLLLRFSSHWQRQI